MELNACWWNEIVFYRSLDTGWVKHVASLSVSLPLRVCAVDGVGLHKILRFSRLICIFLLPIAPSMYMVCECAYIIYIQYT